MPLPAAWTWAPSWESAAGAYSGLACIRCIKHLLPIGIPCAGRHMGVVDFYSGAAGHVSTTICELQRLLLLRLTRLCPPTDLPGTPSIPSLSAQYCAHRARNAPRLSCSSLVASRQAPNLPRTTTNENPRTLPFQTRFRAPSGLFRQCGGERLQLPDLNDNNWRSSDAAGRYAVSPGSNLVPTSANVCCHNDC
jgi:hypothetical protein